ncbi:hypothetical protein [Pseudopontixanthobacter vadosimaris]|uniref:hypothetical protein n=1 Tax=Pseudopontixanthobacter vadosimaris TaxID=2726450 RepID=UPI0014759B01|nr:hypothetical protein [Pseudopontixanthobacter vadosimaris]
MSDKTDPTKPKSNDEKFKPQNVADESAGSVTSKGRADCNMNNDTSRGSESENESRSGNRQS